MKPRFRATLHLPRTVYQPLRAALFGLFRSSNSRRSFGSAPRPGKKSRSSIESGSPALDRTLMASIGLRVLASRTRTGSAPRPTTHRSPHCPVGTNVGAGLDQRGKRAAWIGAALAGCVSGAIGLLFALAPRLWIEIFSSDPEIYAAASRYLEIVGPSDALYGVGLALYFAAQGAGRPMWNLAFGVSRLVLTGLGGAVAVFWFTGGLNSVYAFDGSGSDPVRRRQRVFRSLYELARIRTGWPVRINLIGFFKVLNCGFILQKLKTLPLASPRRSLFSKRHDYGTIRPASRHPSPAR